MTQPAETSPPIRPLVVCLNIRTLFKGNHDDPMIPVFVREFSGILYRSDRGGIKPRNLDQLGGQDLPIRMLLGVPEAQLRIDEMRVTEAACSVILGRPIEQVSNLWVRVRSGWMPSNPNQHCTTSLEGAWLDVAWMSSLGVPRPVWQVWLGTDLWERPKNTKLSTDLVPRWFLSLAQMGFSDPWRFFTTRGGESAAEQPNRRKGTME